MGGRVSVRGIVRVFLALVHELVLCDLGEEKPEHNHRHNALVQRLLDLVPHLVVQTMQLLKAFQVAGLRGSIR